MEYPESSMVTTGDTGDTGERLKRKCTTQSQEMKPLNDDKDLNIGLLSIPSPLKTTNQSKKSKRSAILRVTIPDEQNCKLSDDLADSVKTMCQICEIPINLTGMRSHTMLKHNLQITKYKELYGSFQIIEHVFHKCHLCGKILLLDSDAMGVHIKGKHKMKEREYKTAFMTSSSSSSVYSNQSDSISGSKSSVSKKKATKGNIEYDFKTTFPDYEYSCTSKHCEICGLGGSNIVSEDVAREQKPRCEEHEAMAEENTETRGIESVATVDESSSFGRVGCSNKLLVTDVLHGKYQEDEHVGRDCEGSIDYSEESLVEDSDSS